MWTPVTFRGLPLVPTQAAVRELHQYEMLLVQAADVLEYGDRCGFPRGSDTVERCATVGGRRMKVVAKRGWTPYLDREAWVLVHVGPDTRGG